MEKFEDLLEQYLDEKEIKEKIDADLKEEQEKEKKTPDKKIDDNFVQTIPISEFVLYYLGTKHDCSNLKHRGLKSFKNPYVIGIPNEFAIKNPDCIIKNEILVVIDSYGNPGTYINPTLLKNLQSMEECKNILSILRTIRVNDLENIQTLYSEYMKIIEKIDELEKQYTDSCDLLNLLQKKSILREIRQYVRKAEKKQIEFTKKQNKLFESINFEGRLLDEYENKIELSDELYYDSEDDIDYLDELCEDFDDVCDSKLNRQKKFIQLTKRGIVRKEH